MALRVGGVMFDEHDAGAAFVDVLTQPVDFHLLERGRDGIGLLRRGHGAHIGRRAATLTS